MITYQQIKKLLGIQFLEELGEKHGAIFVSFLFVMYINSGMWVMATLGASNIYQ